MESVNTKMLRFQAHFCLPAGWATLALSPQYCTRSDLRMSEIPNFSWGGGWGMLPHPLSGNSLSPDQPKIASYGPVHASRQTNKQTDRQREHPKGILLLLTTDCCINNKIYVSYTFTTCLNLLQSHIQVDFPQMPQFLSSQLPVCKKAVYLM